MTMINGVPTQQVLKALTPSAPKSTRMSLAGIVRGKLVKPYRVTLYGVEGIGKSTFGANAPSPIFLGSEDGSSQLDVARFPKPESLGDAFDALRELYDGAHEFKTLVVDSLDWLEPLIWRELCKRSQVDLIEEVGGGYGKGYTAAVDEWRKFLSAIEKLQEKRQMHVVLLAHAHIKNFKDPESEGFDRYQMKLNEKAAGVIKEWSDAVLFAKYETLAHTDKKSKRVRGVDTGARLIFTQQRAAFDAKNRYSLPESLPLSWAEFQTAAEAGQVSSPESLKEEIARKAKELGPDFEKTVAEIVAKAGDNTQSLALINNRVNAKLAEKAASQTTAEASAEKAS